jgi:hypothetical protein
LGFAHCHPAKGIRQIAIIKLGTLAEMPFFSFLPKLYHVLFHQLFHSRFAPATKLKILSLPPLPAHSHAHTARTPAGAGR